MDFEITNHFFPSMYVNVYDNLLDVKFATSEHCVYAEGQCIAEHWGFSLIQWVVLGDPGEPLYTGRFLAHTLEM